MTIQRGLRTQLRRFVLPVASVALAFLAGCGGTSNGTTENGGTGGSAPLVNGALPPAGSPAGGTFVTLSGSGFLTDVVGPTSVTFAGLAADNVVVVDDATITLTTPAHTGDAFVDIQVTNSRGTGILSGGFQYLATASIVSDLNSDGYPDIAVGATQDSSGGIASGAVYIFYGSDDPMAVGAKLSGDADLVLRGQAAGDSFGATVQTGDVNADGHTDLVVGAPLADGAAANSGTVSVFLGPLPEAGVLGAAAADIVLTGEGSAAPYYGVDGDEFGAALSLGDVNGDAVLDIYVGSPGVDLNVGLAGELEDAGRAYLFHGGAQLASAGALEADAIVTGVREDDQLGVEVCLADVNGDGLADVATAFDLKVTGAIHAARVAVHTGGLGLGASSDDADVVLRSSTGNSQFGASMTCGDIDQDGVVDLIVGAPHNSQFTSFGGRVFIFLGGAGFSSKYSNDADAIYTGAYAGMRLGNRLASADVNGDGGDDVLASGPYSSSGAVWNGQVFVFYGQASPVDLQAQNCDVILTGEETDGERFGSALEVLDADMDGVADVLSSATGHGGAKGRVYVFRGEESLLDKGADAGDLTITGESEGEGFGSSISRGK